MKKDLRIVKTQENLQQALLTLLKSKPLESITIAELCRLAKINRGTFYLHYKNVHDLFKQYVDVIVKDLKQSYDEPYYKTNYHIQKMEANMIKIFHHVKKYKNFYQIIFDKQIPMMYYYLLFDTIRSFMQETIDESTLSLSGPIQTDYLISYQTNAILGILIEWNRNNFTTPIQELNDQLMSFLTLTNTFHS